MNQLPSSKKYLNGWVRLWEAITEERWPSHRTSTPLYLAAYADWRRDQAASGRPGAAQVVRQVG